MKDGALETLEKSLGNSDNASDDLFETGERESRRTTSLGRDRFLNLIPRLKPTNSARDDAENEIESDVSTASGPSGPSGPNISEADTSMLEAMVSELLMSESADQRTTEAAPLSQSVLTSRRRRLKRPNLFSTEERRKSSIFNRHG